MEISEEILQVVEEINNTLFWLIITMAMYVMIVIFVTCFGTRSLALIAVCFSCRDTRALEVPLQVGPKCMYPDLPPPMAWEDQGLLLTIMTLFALILVSILAICCVVRKVICIQ
jgi:hypothetical protein